MGELPFFGQEFANRLEGDGRKYLVVRGVCSLALLDQVLLRLSTCLMGGSETNSTPLVLLRLSNSPVLRGLRRELDPSCFTASQ